MTVVPPLAGKSPVIDITAFEAEITDFADVFIGPERRLVRSPSTDDVEPYLFVVLPSFSFKIRLTNGNLQVLRQDLDKWISAGELEQ